MTEDPPRGGGRKPLTKRQIEDLADTIEALLLKVAAREMHAPETMKLRLQGALAGLRAALGDDAALQDTLRDAARDGPNETRTSIEEMLASGGAAEAANIERAMEFVAGEPQRIEQAMEFAAREPERMQALLARMKDKYD